MRKKYKIILNMIVDEIIEEKRKEKQRMKELTVNEAMVTAKALRGRLGELSSLRSQCSTKDTMFFGDKNKVTEPMYDVKLLDAKCVDIENALLDIDMKIKQSNATAKIEVDVDAKELMQSIK